MRVYISGPISGRPNGNREAFSLAADHLREHGYEPVNPHDLNPGGGTWEECMRRDIAELVKCDAIALLPGWWSSRGALIEIQIAHVLGIQVVGKEVH